MSKVATPVFHAQPGGTTLYGGWWISISCSTPDATIRYTLDETIPDNTSAEYSDGMFIFLKKKYIFKAKAFKSGLEDSDVAVKDFLKRF